jgi:predicted nucleic acid-binding protein
MKPLKKCSKMTDYLLDTNVLILHFRKRSDITALLTQWQVVGELYISVVTRTEILAGMHPREEPSTLALLDSLNNLVINLEIADQAGRLIYQYGRQGAQLSLPDAQIAATALGHKLTLVTTNVKHFPMPNLTLYPIS